MITLGDASGDFDYRRRPLGDSQREEFETSQMGKNHEIPDTDDLRQRSTFGGCGRGTAGGPAADRRSTGLRAGIGGVRLSLSGSALCLHVAAAVAADDLSRPQAGPAGRADVGGVARPEL